MEEIAAWEEAAQSRSPHGERGLKFNNGSCLGEDVPSLPSRGAWIEIDHSYQSRAGRQGSLPSRGAWIEICNYKEVILHAQRRSPHGERGLKLVCLASSGDIWRSRSPHGERGLKSNSRRALLRE